MIHVLLFDVSGVLQNGSMQSALREFAARRGVDADEILRIRRERFHDMRRGAFDTAELFHAAGIEGKTEDLLAEWIEVARRSLVPNGALLTAMRQWRSKGYRTAILSNGSDLRVALDRALGIFDGCDPVVLSWEIGSQKPELEVYRVALQRIDVPAEEIVFIDDSEENLPPARALGMHTILFTDNMALVRDLAALGVS